MKKSEFESLTISEALTFIAEQAGVKWDAEGVEGLREEGQVRRIVDTLDRLERGADLRAERDHLAEEAIRLSEQLNLIHFQGGGIHSLPSGSVTAYRPDRNGQHRSKQIRLRPDEHLSSAILRAIKAVDASLGEKP